MKKLFIVFVIFLSLFIFLLKISFASNPDYKSRVIFFDVGQGDAALVQTEFAQDILIDGGPDKSIVEKLDKEMGALNRDIELAVLSHNHGDHLIGLIKLIKSGFKIEKLIYSSSGCESPACGEFYSLADQEGIEKIQAEPGMKIDFFCLEADAGGCSGIEIMGPDAKFAADKNLNNTSIILRLDLCGNVFIFAGDAENKVWREYCESAALRNFQKADILKAPHHGSKNGIAQCLLEAADFKEAVISSGKGNKFGHPDSGILELLSSLEIKIRRTDEEGDIVYKF